MFVRSFAAAMVSTCRAVVVVRPGGKAGSALSAWTSARWPTVAAMASALRAPASVGWASRESTVI